MSYKATMEQVKVVVLFCPWEMALHLFITNIQIYEEWVALKFFFKRQFNFYFHFVF